MRVGIACDHEAFDVKGELIEALRAAGHEVADFGVYSLDPDEDYPDFMIPLARSVASAETERGVALCRNTVGACICANKIPGARAGAPLDHLTVWRGVEDSHMNLICLNMAAVGRSVAWDLLQTFLAAQFSQAEPHLRRLAKVSNLEKPEARVRRAR